jgi:hypothetical protein
VISSRALACLALPLALAACNAPRETPQPQASAAMGAMPPGVTPQGFRLPEGAGCAGEVARWRAIQDNDLATGHVSRSVYDRIQKDIAAAQAACAAGREAEASALVRASRARNGYPAS